MQRSGAILPVLTTLLAVQALLKPANAITCDDVDFYLTWCIFSLVFGGDPSDGCCDGLRSLQANTPTVQDRRQACQCLKDEASGLLPGSDAAARALPGKCSVQLDIPISGDFDCSTIN